MITMITVIYIIKGEVVVWWVDYSTVMIPKLDFYT